MSGRISLETLVVESHSLPNRQHACTLASSSCGLLPHFFFLFPLLAILRSQIKAAPFPCDGVKLNLCDQERPK